MYRKILPFVALFLLVRAACFAGLPEGVAAYAKGDYKTAFKEFKPLAEQGDLNAQYYLGLMYANGQGVLQDYKEAYHWMNLVASRGVKTITPQIEETQELAKEEPSVQAEDKQALVKEEINVNARKEQAISRKEVPVQPEKRQVTPREEAPAQAEKKQTLAKNEVPVQGEKMQELAKEATSARIEKAQQLSRIYWKKYVEEEVEKLNWEISLR